MEKMNKIMNDLYNEELAIDCDVKPVDPNPTLEKCCNTTDFCCLIKAPKDAKSTDKLSAGIFVDPTCLELFEKELKHVDIKEIEDCKLNLWKYTIKACVKVYVSAGFEDSYKNDFYICCENCLCLKDCVYCCHENLNKDDIKFETKDLKIQDLKVSSCGTKIYKLTGKIAVHLDTCNNN